MLAVSFLFTINSYSQKSKKKTVKSVGNISETLKEEFRAPFRYVIIAGVSRIEKYRNENPDSAYIEVLMEDKAFNEKNLKILFELLSKRFTEKWGLSVTVYTTLDALYTPEENDVLDLKGITEEHQKKYKWAIFNRNGHGEYFWYGMPNDISGKRVQIKPPKN